jgi:hypothetical protein
MRILLVLGLPWTPVGAHLSARRVANVEDYANCRERYEAKLERIE